VCTKTLLATSSSPSESLSLVVCLARVLDAPGEELFGISVRSLSSQSELLSLVKVLMEHEFESKHQTEPGSILRGNSLATSLASKVIHAAAASYLAELLNPWLTNLALLDAIDVASNAQQLFDVATELVETLSKDEVVGRLPPDVADLAQLIASLCDKYLPEQKWPLVGGLVLLRLVCPMLTSPATMGLLPKDRIVTPEFRKNLVQVARLLQNASNHMQFKVQFLRAWIVHVTAALICNCKKKGGSKRSAQRVGLALLSRARSIS
jgi:hypothetical protein